MPSGSGVDGNAAKFGQALPQHFGLRRVAELLQARFVQMRGLRQAQTLGNGDQSVHAQVGHRFVGGLHRRGVQFQPAGVGQFDEAAGGGLEALQVGGGQFESFGLPFRGNGKPINAAALDDEARPQRARGQEEPVKGGVAEVFGLGAAGPARRRPGRRGSSRWHRRARGRVRG